MPAQFIILAIRADFSDAAATSLRAGSTGYTLPFVPDTAHVSDCACHRPGQGAAPSPVAPPRAATTLSRFALPGMDCPAEEQQVRAQLAGEAGIAHLAFDLPARRLSVYHDGSVAPIQARLEALGFGCQPLDSTPTAEPPPRDDAPAERRVLWQLMAINAAMFVVEVVAGWWAQSTGLLADGLDMLADAAVYALALLAVGGAAGRRLRTAHLSGWLQAALGAGIAFEVGRRIVFGAAPHPPVMLAIAALALVANVACVVLLARHRNGGAHMQASWIFTANDALANLGVIVAGVLVAWLHTPWPDWIMGTAIGALILSGAWRILRLR